MPEFLSRWMEWFRARSPRDRRTIVVAAILAVGIPTTVALQAATKLDQMVESLPTLSWATNPALIVVVVVLVTYVVAKTWK